jgi:mono/diheme cytochrome c family protein
MRHLHFQKQPFVQVRHLLAALVLAWTAVPAPGSTPVDFDREVRPILADNCFACHGPDAGQRKAKLRLDTPEGALGPRPGGPVIVPGQPDNSQLIQHITSDDPETRMPPPKTGKRLSAAQVEILRRWINEGAKWSIHWSFRTPQRPLLTNVRDSSWVRNPIDRFILARLEKEGLPPSPEADRVTLLRRLTLDLTGLPPTPAEVDAFCADQHPQAYEKVVERLLASPRYGERMALEWLDAARFADTHGYHIDSGRDMTRWRDWVIDAFNRNKPFDEFTVEQLAGDLLPGATVEQKIASGFHRNHMINFEGGAIPQEYHTAYIVDRVNTTGTVWLGLSVACAQCHDHKYDPIRQREYYQLYAFFHNVPENGLDGSKGNAAPLLKVPTREQRRRLDQLDQAILDLEKRLKGPLKPQEQKPLGEQLAAMKKSREALSNSIPSTMVMEEMNQPRETFVLVRGQYDKKGEKIKAATPAFLPPLPAGAPANRLGLARWLVDPSHPLTARVAVNRYWQMYFGTGLVKTAEDFGTQGERPSHPELLDYLAVEFVRSGWDIKRLQRLIVTSATYRQSSVVQPELLARDPENRLLARASRLRLQAEFIRDQALFISGLLNRDIGGASVSPYQPPGLWEELASRLDGANWTAQTYKQSHGRDLYRRSMYTFWKRTSPPPTLTTFDAPDRETCTVRRARTNTPLQALILMNDPTYVEAGRKLAERILAESGQDAQERIAFAFRLVTARAPRPAEIAVLRKVLDEQLAVYRADSQAALRLLKIGEAPRGERFDPVELAAWGVVAGILLNLDETVTRN